MSDERWFSYRGLFAIRAVDTPNSTCDHSFEGYMKIDERVLLLRAPSREAAEQQAADEAQEFVQLFDGAWNACGQELRVELVGLSDVVPIPAPDANMEVFGDLFVVRDLSLEEIRDRWLREEESWRGDALDHFNDLRNDERVHRLLEESKTRRPPEPEFPLTIRSFSDGLLASEHHFQDAVALGHDLVSFDGEQFEEGVVAVVDVKGRPRPVEGRGTRGDRVRAVPGVDRFTPVPACHGSR